MKDFDRSTALRFAGIGILLGQVQPLDDDYILQFAVGAALILTGYLVPFRKD